mgnify:CR=1 FL=1
MFDVSGFYPLLIIASLVGLTIVALTAGLTLIARPLGLLDYPNFRKHHDSEVPVVGGIAIYITMVAFLSFIPLPNKLTWILFSASIIVVVGALDDIFNLSIKFRLLAQLTATLTMIIGGKLWVQSVGFELIDEFIFFQWITIPFTALAVIGLTNGFNMADGIDGLAAGYMMSGIATLCLSLFVVIGSVHQAVWMTVLFTAVLTFFLINMSLTPVSKVFLGDAGSLLLGFVMSWLLIYYTQRPHAYLQPVAALWCVTIPVYDTIAVTIKRLRERRSPFHPDRSHLHHFLIDRGCSQLATLWTILVGSLVINILGLVVTYSFSPLYSLVFYILLLNIFVFFRITR